MIVEIVMGLISNSLALIADAGHMLSDVLSIGITLLALNIAVRPQTSKFSFGYSRAEILVALFNGFTLLVVSGYIIMEAIERLGDERIILAPAMLMTAFLGLLVNIWALKYLKQHANHSVTLKSAYFHVLADILGSVAAIVAGILIIFTGMSIWDLIVSILISVLIAIPGLKIMKNTLLILMQTTPANIDVDRIADDLRSNVMIEEVHDLHVWSLDGENTMLTAHLVVDEKYCQHDHQRIMNRVQTILLDNHNIEHSTLQIENDSEKEMINCIKCD